MNSRYQHQLDPKYSEQSLLLCIQVDRLKQDNSMHATATSNVSPRQASHAKYDQRLVSKQKSASIKTITFQRKFP
jgi:hypothetical protein